MVAEFLRQLVDGAVHSPDDRLLAVHGGAAASDRCDPQQGSARRDPGRSVADGGDEPSGGARQLHAAASGADFAWPVASGDRHRGADAHAAAGQPLAPRPKPVGAGTGAGASLVSSFLINSKAATSRGRTSTPLHAKARA